MLTGCLGKDRYALVLLLLCLVVVAQSAALISANEQHHSQDHCCTLCHLGPMPFLHTHVAAVALPALFVVWLEPASAFIATHDVFLPIGSSRAPPA
jgi:hypothetical protein